MGFFQHSHAFNINGGEFSEVHGDQNNYNYANSLQMGGKNNSATIVNGEYHNGSNNSITNQAGGDIHVYGQGDGCEVIMGSGVPFFVNQPRSSRRTPSPSYGGSPVTFNRGSGQGPNGGIINNAGSMQVIGQGQNSQIQIGCNGPLPHSYMPPMYPHYQAYNPRYGNIAQPQPPFPFQDGATLQHEIRTQAPYSMNFSADGLSSASPMKFQPNNYHSGNNHCVGDYMSSNMMVRSDPAGSSTSGVVDAGISHKPEAYSPTHPIPSPPLEPVTPVPLSHPIPASISMPVPELPPAPPVSRNAPTAEVPAFVAVSPPIQSANVSPNHVPRTPPLPPPTLFPAPELPGSLPFAKVQLPSPQSAAQLASSRSDTLNTESTSKTAFSTTDASSKTTTSSPYSLLPVEAPLKTEPTSDGISPKTSPLKPKRKRCFLLSWIIRKKF